MEPTTASNQPHWVTLDGLTRVDRQTVRAWDTEEIFWCVWTDSACLRHWSWRYILMRVETDIACTWRWRDILMRVDRQTDRQCVLIDTKNIFCMTRVDRQCVLKPLKRYSAWRVSTDTENIIWHVWTERQCNTTTTATTTVTTMTTTGTTSMTTMHRGHHHHHCHDHHDHNHDHHRDYRDRHHHGHCDYKYR